MIYYGLYDYKVLYFAIMSIDKRADLVPEYVLAGIVETLKYESMLVQEISMVESALVIR